MSAYITKADLRDEMMDRAAEDHLVLADLAFTDADLEWSMKACSRKFNAIRPLGFSIEWDKLPLNTSVFLDGCAWALYRRWHRNVCMNDMDYQAGGVSASVQGSLRKNLADVTAKLEQEFIAAATDLKVSANLESAWGVIG